MDYTYEITLMKWSFSRLSLYRTCAYAWFCQYILREDKQSNFYSEYGTFVHELLAEFYKGNITRDELLIYYITDFNSKVTSVIPSKTFDTMREKYYESGLKYIETFEPFQFKEILGIEEEVHFKIDEYDFIGYIDMHGLRDDDEIEIIDNKSKDLKPRSKRKAPTKTDNELDIYLIQLYLYCIPIYDKYGKYPKYLTFNCFKSGVVITEPFDIEKFEEAKDWAIRTIKKIEKQENWNPHLDFYFCNNLCNARSDCEYIGNGSD